MKIQFVIEVNNHLSLRYVGGDEEARLKEQAPKEEAEAHAYRLPNGNIGIPATHPCGCLRDYLIAHAGNKKKTETEKEVRARIRITPLMLDTGLKDYEVDSRLVLVKKSGRIASIVRCARPLIRKCQVTGILETTLDEPVDALSRKFGSALSEIGMGSDRIDGYGRGTVISFKEVTP